MYVIEYNLSSINGLTRDSIENINEEKNKTYIKKFPYTIKDKAQNN